MSALTLAADLVESVALQDRTATEALAILEAHGGTADADALAEAVGALQLLEMWRAHQGDPVAFTGVDFSADSSVSVWDLAVELAEDCLASHLGLLAMQP